LRYSCESPQVGCALCGAGYVSQLMVRKPPFPALRGTRATKWFPQQGVEVGALHGVSGVALANVLRGRDELS